MPASKGTRMRREGTRMRPEIFHLPSSEITLAILDILLEDPMNPINGKELTGLVEKRLKRRVNYSGVLKQVRSYARKPYWNLVLVCEEKSSLCLYARKGPLTAKLHRAVHDLYDLSHTLSEVRRLKRELGDLKNKVLTDPFFDEKEVEKKRRTIESKLNTLLQ